MASLVSNLAANTAVDSSSYKLEENPSLVGAYTNINGISSSKNSQNRASITSCPDYSSIGTGISLGTSIGGWAIDRNNGDLFYSSSFEFRHNLEIDDLCRENGLTNAVEGLYKSVLLTPEEDEIVKIWKNSNDSIEEFFVLGAIHGNIDVDVMIALSEVALEDLLGKSFGDLHDIEGMSKNFFKIIEFTDYLDDLITDSQFIRYWLRRRQDLLKIKPEAAKLVEYMLSIIQEKKMAATCQN